jgi:hypothetical protein
MAPPMSSANHAAKQRRVRRLSDIRDNPARTWRVNELVEDGGSLLIVAEEKFGKSVLAAALTAAVVTGRPFFGMATKKGAVLYIASEKEREARNRLRRLLTAAEQSAILIHGRVDLHADAATARQILTEANQILAEDGRRLAMVVIDTAGAAMGDGDENTTRDAKRLCDSLDILRSTGAAVVVIHHAKRETGRSRGSQYFPAWADTVVCVEKTKAGRFFKVTRSNVIADDGRPIPFAIEGRPIDPENPDAGTVAVAVEAPEASGKPKNGMGRERPLIGYAASVFQILTRLAPDGKNVPIVRLRQEFEKAENLTGPKARQAWSDLNNRRKSRLFLEGFIEGDAISVRLCQPSEKRQELSDLFHRQASEDASAPL